MTDRRPTDTAYPEWVAYEPAGAAGRARQGLEIGCGLGRIAFPLRCVSSFFLLDQIRYGVARPDPFDRPDFDFGHRLPGWGDEFRYVQPDNPEQMTGYRTSLVARFAAEAGLAMLPPVPGRWSGIHADSVTTQDFVILSRSV